MKRIKWASVAVSNEGGELDVNDLEAPEYGVKDIDYYFSSNLHGPDGNVTQDVYLMIYNSSPLYDKTEGEITSCFIATMVYENPNAPEIQVLRNFRDNVLMETGLGRKAVDLYYNWFGERAADFIREYASFMIPTIRKGLDHIVQRYQVKE